MKKRESLFFLITILFLLFNAPLLATEGERGIINLSVMGQEFSVETLNKSGVILIPTRALIQAIGADLDWVPSLSILKITYVDQEYLLRVDDHLIQVGSSVERLKVPVLLEDGRTFLSLSCISSLLGFRLVEEQGTYKLEKPSHQLKGITYDKGEVIFTFKGDPKILFTEDLIQERVTVEIIDVGKDKDFTIKGFTTGLPIERVRLLQPQVDRIVVTFYLNRWQEYFLTKDLRDDQLIFSMRPGATVTQIGYDEERNRFVIVARGEMEDFSYMSLEDPYRLVLDIPKTRMDISDEFIPERHPVVEKIRLRAHEDDMLRVVFDMSEPLDFDFALSPDGRFLVLTGEKRDLLITKIAFQEVGGRPEVVITGTQALNPEIFYLPEPHRLVLDFPYSALNLHYQEVHVGQPPVIGIRASQYPGEKSRVVIDLDDLVEYLVKTDPQHPEKTVIAFPPGNFHVFLQDTPAATRVVIDTPYQLEYETRKFSYPDRLVVDLKENILHISEDDIPIGNGMVSHINLAHFSQDPVMTRLIFHLPYYVGHNIVSPMQHNRIEIDLFKSDLRNRSIFIDPGHGGVDPGAVGITGTFEKDVVLDISLRLETLLKQAGAQVIMSRRQDLYLDLKERVDLANASPAEIFVSVHANSVAHDYPMGTETYVSSNASNLSLQLAQLVQQELIHYLGLHNRGVKKRDFYVIKATRMPSILVEVAFLSNIHEEKLLKDPAFRQRAAEAIFSGIKRYFHVR